MVKKCWEYNITSGACACFESAKVNPTIDTTISSQDSDAGSHANPVRKSIKYGTTFQAAKGIFLEYFNDSSIHGFKYLSDPKRSAIERIIWLCAVCLSIITCSIFIKNIWDKYNSTPVIITFSEKQTDIWDIPFPTVTICAEAKSDPVLFNFTNTHWKILQNENITIEEQYYWDAISQICHPRYESGRDYAKSSHLFHAMRSAFLYPLNEDIEVKWMGRKYNRKLIPILTTEGFCYSFNSIDGSHFIRDEYLDTMNYTGNEELSWNLREGYSKEAEESNLFPVHAQGSGSTLELIVIHPKRDDRLCSEFKGFKIVLHSPGELPDVSKNFIIIPFDLQTSVNIKPEVIYTSKELEKYEPERRQCYFPNERPLRYFKNYTKTNCELECLSNLTFAECGCVKFSMPRHSSQEVCGPNKIFCLVEVKKYLSFHKLKAKRNCDCLPSCISIQYNAELEYQVPLDYIGDLRALKFDEVIQYLEESGKGYNFISVHFKDDVFNALKRSELYTSTDLIANCGGLLGLFMGVSILSLVEFVYFFTIRLWVNLKMRKTKQLQLRKFKENA